MEVHPLVGQLRFTRTEFFRAIKTSTTAMPGRGSSP